MLKKTLFYGGLVALGWWLARRHAAPRPALGGVGEDLYAYPKLAPLAGVQVTRALAGQALTDYRSAGGRALFQQAPTTDALAYAVTAWWVAVAARLRGGDRTLARTAGSLLARGSALYSIPGSSFFTGKIGTILTEGRDAILARGAPSDQVKAVIAALDRFRDPRAIASAQATARDKEVLQRTAEASVADAASLAQRGTEGAADALSPIRAFFGMANPKTGQPYPWWARWGSRAVVGGFALLGLRLYFAPQYLAAKTAVKGLLPSAPPSTAAPSQEAA